jgi:hypothetical protein
MPAQTAANAEAFRRPLHEKNPSAAAPPKDDGQHAKLAALLASGGGVDTFGNEGTMRVPVYVPSHYFFSPLPSLFLSVMTLSYFCFFWMVVQRISVPPLQPSRRPKNRHPSGRIIRVEPIHDELVHQRSTPTTTTAR